MSEKKRVSYLFRFDVAKNVMPKHSLSSKELVFGLRKAKSCGEFELDQMKSADEIRKLKQPISRWPDFFRKRHIAADFAFKDLVQQPCYVRLPAIVVYLDTFKRREKCVVGCNESNEFSFETAEDLIGRINEPLIDAQAMIFKINSAGKRHHARKDTAAQLATKHGIVFFVPDERSCMKTMSNEPYLCIRLFKFLNFTRNVNRLIVKYHANNIESRFTIRNIHTAGFVNKYAQNSFSHSGLLLKRKWREFHPATNAESFPRIPVTRSRRKRPVRIVPDCLVRCKSEFDECEEAAA